MFKISLATGFFGAIGALIGIQIARLIPEQELTRMTASVLLWLRIIAVPHLFTSRQEVRVDTRELHFWVSSAIIGLTTGALSSMFGIGSTPFIQIGLLLFFRCSIQKTAGTTLLIILPIALVGGLGYFSLGYLDIMLFIKVVVGIIIGSYIGAKFTNRLPSNVLKFFMIMVPAIGAMILFLGAK